MNDEEFLLISELFFSIQGESTYAGLPCVFIRLHGCNLRCAYCDARYTYEEPGEKRAISELLDFCDHSPKAIVEITGGEPLIQQGCAALCEALCHAGRTVLVETNGSVDISVLPLAVIKIMDLKCPDSGMSKHIYWHNLEQLSPKDEVKFVLSSRADYDWARDTLLRFPALSALDPGNVLFSPVTTTLSPENLALWILEDQLPVRLQLQLHKQLWPACQRGV